MEYDPLTIDDLQTRLKASSARYTRYLERVLRCEEQLAAAGFRVPLECQIEGVIAKLNAITADRDHLAKELQQRVDQIEAIYLVLQGPHDNPTT